MFPHDVAYILTFHLCRHEDTFVLPFFFVTKKPLRKNGNIYVFYYLCENIQL